MPTRIKFRTVESGKTPVRIVIPNAERNGKPLCVTAADVKAISREREREKKARIGKSRKGINSGRARGESRPHVRTA